MIGRRRVGTGRGTGEIAAGLAVTPGGGRAVSGDRKVYVLIGGGGRSPGCGVAGRGLRQGIAGQNWRGDIGRPARPRVIGCKSRRKEHRGGRQRGRERRHPGGRATAPNGRAKKGIVRGVFAIKTRPGWLDPPGSGSIRAVLPPSGGRRSGALPQKSNIIDSRVQTHARQFPLSVCCLRRFPHEPGLK